MSFLTFRSHWGFFSRYLGNIDTKITCITLTKETLAALKYVVNIIIECTSGICNWSSVFSANASSKDWKKPFSTAIKACLRTALICSSLILAVQKKYIQKGPNSKGDLTYHYEFLIFFPTWGLFWYYMRQECLIREFFFYKQTTTTSATGPSLTKRFNEQNNGCACLFEIFVHFVAVHCQTTWNSQILNSLKYMSYNGNLLSPFFKLNTTICIHIQFRDSSYSYTQTEWLKIIARFVVIAKYKVNTFFNWHCPWRCHRGCLKSLF